MKRGLVRRRVPIFLASGARAQIGLGREAGKVRYCTAALCSRLFFPIAATFSPAPIGKACSSPQQHLRYIVESLFMIHQRRQQKGATNPPLRNPSVMRTIHSCSYSRHGPGHHHVPLSATPFPAPSVHPGEANTVTRRALQEIAQHARSREAHETGVDAGRHGSIGGARL